MNISNLPLKLFFIFFVCTLPNYASLKDLETYQADFTQTIIDQDNSKVVYKGTFLALKPLKAVWHYDSPVKKSVYINSRQIVIVEPELEQAIYKESNSAFTLFTILDNATKVDANTYEKRIGEKTYRLSVKKNKIQTLHYRDDFDNNVTIVFNKQKPNLPLKAKSFHPIISEDFDIIKE